MPNKSETQDTTSPITQPRRGVKLNAETLRALEVQDADPRLQRAPGTIGCTVFNCDPTGPQ